MNPTTGYETTDNNTNKRSGEICKILISAFVSRKLTNSESLKDEVEKEKDDQQLMREVLRQF